MNRTLRLPASILALTFAIVAFVAVQEGCGELAVSLVDAGTDAGSSDGASHDGDSSVRDSGGTPKDTGAEAGPTDAGRMDTSSGCTSYAECPIGQACDLTTHTCTTTCSPYQPCNGVCCVNEADASAGPPTCAIPGTTATCGTTDSLCFSCAGNSTGTACLSSGVCGCAAKADCTQSPIGYVCLSSGSCGCNSMSDCPAGQLCNAGQCAPCSSSSPCPTGCCHLEDLGDGGTADDSGPPQTGLCTGGTDPSTCGTSGICVDCAESSFGQACLPSGSCGCASAADCAGTGAYGIDYGGGMECLPSGKCGCTSMAACPGGAVCDTKSNTCTPCSSTLPCTTGCCDTGMDPAQCMGGTDPGACGTSGICVNCTGGTSGAACLPSGTCGCNGASDCPLYEACDTTTHACTTACSSMQTCNGGCCSAPSGGTCGCCAASDCPKGQACDTTTSTCTKACSSSRTCNGGCCSASDGGTCTAGASTTACGSGGGVCVDCRGGETCSCGFKGDCACK